MFFLAIKFKFPKLCFLNSRNYTTFNDLCLKFQNFQFYQKNQKKEICKPLVELNTPFIHRSSIKPWDFVENVIDSRFEKRGSNDRMDHPLSAMYGHSRSGKSRMLAEIGKYFNEKNCIVIPVNYNGKTPVADEEKAAITATELINCLSLRLIAACSKTPSDCLEALSKDKIEITIENAIRLIHEYYKQDENTRVLILIDEILKLVSERIDKDVIIVHFISKLCSILHQTYPFVTFVISSLAESPLNKMRTGSGRPIEYIDLSPFDISTSKQFVKEIYKKVENNRDLTKAVDFCVTACGGVAGALTHLNVALKSYLDCTEIAKWNPYYLCQYCETAMVRYFTNIYESFIKAIVNDKTLIMRILFTDEIATTEELYNKYQRIAPIQQADNRMLILPLYMLLSFSLGTRFDRQGWPKHIATLLKYDKDSFRTTGMGLENFITSYHYLLFLSYKMNIMQIPQSIIEFYKIDFHLSYLEGNLSRTNDEKEKAVLNELIEYNEYIRNKNENPLGTSQFVFPSDFEYETPKTFPKDYTTTTSYIDGKSFVHPTNKNNHVCEGGFSLLSMDKQTMLHVFIQCKQYKDNHPMKPIKEQYIDNFIAKSKIENVTQKWYIVYFMNIETHTNLSKKLDIQRQCNLSNTNSLFLFKENMEYWIAPTFRNLLTFLKTLDTK
jgi:hypothetical protein